MDEHCRDRPAQAKVAGDAGGCRKGTDGNRAFIDPLWVWNGPRPLEQSRLSLGDLNS